MERDKITKAINRIQNKMSRDVEEFEKQVEEIEDEKDLDDYTTQHVLHRQHNQEQLHNLQQKLNKKEFAGLSYHISDPTSYQEVMQTDEPDEWKKAIDEEMEVLGNRGVGEEVDRPRNKKVLKGRCVYKVKVKQDGTIERRKGRYCAKGYSQKPGEDFDDIYVPVARLVSLRILLSTSVKRNYTIKQLDVKSAFLYRDIDGETYLEMPEGYRELGKVWKLRKAIYGLKQSPLLWYFYLTEALKEFNLSVSDFDPCILVSKDLYCCVYVDDILITGKPHLVNECINKLQLRFKYTDSGETLLLLCMQIDRTPKYIRLYQEQYIVEILERFCMKDCNPVKTLIEAHTPLQTATDNDQLCDQKLYQSLKGSLMYAATPTRPGIAHATHFLGQFSAQPTETHLVAAKRVLRYLRGTPTMGIKYNYESNHIPLRVYSDSSFASNLTDRHSYTGLIIQTHGHTVIWRSKKQKTVSDSTTVAEYVALAFAAKQSIWVRRGLSLLGINTVPTIHCDNTAAIRLTENSGVSDRTKHIDVKYHLVRELREKGEIRVVSVGTKDNLADVCTKGLTRVLFKGFLDRLGMET